MGKFVLRRVRAPLNAALRKEQSLEDIIKESYGESYGTCVVTAS